MLGFWKQIPNPFDLVLMPIALVCYPIFMARNGMIGRKELCLSFHCSLIYMRFLITAPFVNYHLHRMSGLNSTCITHHLNILDKCKIHNVQNSSFHSTLP